MNSDPENFEKIRDSEALQKSLFAWLLNQPTEKASPGGDNSYQESLASDSGAIPTAEPEAEYLEFNDLDPLELEAPFNFSELENSPLYSGEYILNRGEIPAVQDRFYSVLKRRLQTEIQRNPPLFPWETEILDYYETSTSDSVQDLFVPNILWMPQLENLKLPPVQIPAAVLMQILARCQALVKTSLAEGVKLVRAVESLFPGHSQDLNQLVSLVLMHPSRGSASETTDDFPSSYEVATDSQQMALSLMAAKEILGSLTLPISKAKPRIERQWLTSVGLLQLEAEYKFTRNFASVRVQAYLPCGGSLEVVGNQSEASGKRSSPGYLCVELFDLVSDRTYPLEIKFQEEEQQTLIFSLYPTLD